MMGAMFTWLPYEDFWQSAQAMDLRTLSVQRFDAWRVLNSLYHDRPRTHMVVEMWRGHSHWLISYGNAVCQEWERRTMQRNSLTTFFKDASDKANLDGVDYPDWLGDPALHVSHRSNMIRLNPEHYQKLWPGVPEGLPIYFPTLSEEQQ